MENSASTIDAPEKPLPLSLPAEKEQTLAPAPKEKEDTLHWLNRVLKIAAYPIAAVSGLWAASTELHVGAYQKLKNAPGNPYFGKITAQFEPAKIKNSRKFLSPEGSPEKISTAEWFAEELAIKGKQSPGVGKVMKDAGFSENIFDLKAFYKKSLFVNRETRNNSIISGLTVAGIAIGAMLTIANSKTLIEMFAGKEEKDQEKAR